MEILYLSGVATRSAIEDARRCDPFFSGYAMQKFNRLVAEGLAHNNCQIKVLSTFFMPRVGHGYYRPKETENGVNYHYIPSPNYSFLRHPWLSLFCFFRVLFWGIVGVKKKVLIADALNISACLGAVAAARLIGLRCVGIVTDVPNYHFGRNDSVDADLKRKQSIGVKLNNCYLTRFTHYVFLTDQMNIIINSHNRPYIVMEGLVESSISIVDNEQKYSKKVAIYAGGLMERYGLKTLVDGFVKANVGGTELWIYGSGPFADQLGEYHRKYPSIIYKGIRPNDEVVEAEKKAVLLLNPRPTHEEFTKYSFPSKNMEYMASGTPLLTTMLPGMPQEYYPYVYSFDEGETVEGYASVLKRILSLPSEELHAKGTAAQRWVLANKNNIVQTSRIIEMLGVGFSLR